MKNFLTACLPALALFALGGCAGTSALTSSEDDGVYYSSKDRTTAVVQAAPAPASPNEEANPDYNGGTSSSSRVQQQGSGSTQYYDNSYTYMRGAPGYGGSSAYYGGSGLNNYAPYSPYTSLSYAPFGSVCTGFGYGWGGGAYGYSPYAYGGYDPFYSSPYGYGYSPYYGYGSGLSISFGFGRPYYGGYGYSPYSYGYSPYYYGGSYYGGYYGRGGYYGNSYGGGYYGGNNGGYYSGDNNGSGRTYGHRNDRASEGRYGAAPATGTGGGSTPAGGHVRGERAAGSGGLRDDVATDGLNGLRRDGIAPTGGYTNQPQRMDEAARPRYRNMEAPVATAPNNGTRADVQPQIQPAAVPQEGRRRGGFFQNVLGEPVGNGNTGNGQAAEQPRQRTFEQPRQRTYEQPRQQTYEQPRQQTYEQPQRSYSQPSYGGGGGGGGGNNGGGGGGRRGRD